MLLPFESSHASIKVEGNNVAICPVLIPLPAHISRMEPSFHKRRTISATSIDDSLCTVTVPSLKPGISGGKAKEAVLTE
ncbi:hypothetical protein SDC9_209766 [bioreactor metagenome]|uniref:Uncharacterized protein n=1 Tax=bioreactor metagenome TaxID=1076179 RepID=A0A645JFY7_9ZZZZ